MKSYEYIANFHGKRSLFLQMHFCTFLFIKITQLLMKFSVQKKKKKKYIYIYTIKLLYAMYIFEDKTEEMKRQIKKKNNNRKYLQKIAAKNKNQEIDFSPQRGFDRF